MTRTRWKLFAWAGTLGVLVLCFLPGNDLPDVDALGADKLLHAAGFFVLGICWRRATGSARGALLIGALLACVTELVQYLFVAGRQGDLHDIAADLVGLALGTLLAALLPLRVRA